MSHAISFIIIFFLIHNTTQQTKKHFILFFLEGFAREVEGDKTTIGEGRSVGRGEARQGKKRVEGVT